MYPSIIMSVNISPETKVGRVYDWNAKEVARGGGRDSYDVYLFDKNKLMTFPKDKLLQMLRNHELSIAANGVFYRNDRRGIIPQILEEWYEERNRYKQLRNEWREKEGEEAEEKADYFDNMQHVHKILINSVYGVLGLPTFRFYDIDNAMAVTDTGRALIGFSEDMGNKYYNEELDATEDWCVYTDTDSVTGETKVRTNRYGAAPIADVFEREFSREDAKTLEDGGREFVFPDNLKTPSTRYGRQQRQDDVDYIERHETEKRLFRVEAESGESVVVTSDHSVMTRGPDGRLQEKKPQDLSEGDTLIKIVHD
jgi:DNA polymerase elongation subunit (family B)